MAESDAPKNWKRTSVKGQSSRRELDIFPHVFGCFAEAYNSMKYRRLKQGYFHAAWEAFPRAAQAVSLALEELATIKYGYYDVARHEIEISMAPEPAQATLGTHKNAQLFDPACMSPA